MVLPSNAPVSPTTLDERGVKPLRQRVAGEERQDGTLEHVARDVAEISEERGVAGLGVAQRTLGRAQESEHREDLLVLRELDTRLLVPGLAEWIDEDEHRVDHAAEDAAVLVDGVDRFAVLTFVVAPHQFDAGVFLELHEVEEQERRP